MRAQTIRPSSFNFLVVAQPLAWRCTARTPLRLAYGQLDSFEMELQQTVKDLLHLVFLKIRGSNEWLCLPEISPTKTKYITVNFIQVVYLLKSTSIATRSHGYQIFITT